MMIKNTINGKIFVIIIALALSGCAGANEFEYTPQKGAHRTGVFPSFTQRPQAETAQFTTAERDELATKLIKNRNMVEKNAPPTGSSAKDIEQQKQDAAKAAKETLRKIEQAD